MFTGIITAVGTVQQPPIATPTGWSSTIAASYPDMEPGESIAVDGACLTVESCCRTGGFKRARHPHFTRPHPIRRLRASVDGSTWSGRFGWVIGWAGTWSRAMWTGLGQVEQVSQRDDARLLDLRVPR